MSIKNWTESTKPSHRACWKVILMVMALPSFPQLLNLKQVPGHNAFHYLSHTASQLFICVWRGDVRAGTLSTNTDKIEW